LTEGCFTQQGQISFCFNNSAHNTNHKTHGFPIMKKVGYKFKLRSTKASREVTSRVATKGATPAPPPPPALTTGSKLAGSSTVPGAFLTSPKTDTLWQQI
jgi:hypothetical protein